MEEATDEEIKDDNTSDISQSQEGEEVRGMETTISRSSVLHFSLHNNNFSPKDHLAVKYNHTFG